MNYLRVSIENDTIVGLSMWRAGFKYAGESCLTESVSRFEEKKFMNTYHDKYKITLITISDKDFLFLLDKQFNCQENLDYLRLHYPEVFL